MCVSNTLSVKTSADSSDSLQTIKLYVAVYSLGPNQRLRSSWVIWSITWHLRSNNIRTCLSHPFARERCYLSVCPFFESNNRFYSSASNYNCKPIHLSRSKRMRLKIVLLFRNVSWCECAVVLRIFNGGEQWSFAKDLVGTISGEGMGGDLALRFPQTFRAKIFERPF